MTDAPAPPPPDDKDWTWVLDTPCPDCGFDAGALRRDELPVRIRDCGARLEVALAGPDSAQRPHFETWSVLEYACHVRDVCRIFSERVELMLTEVAPGFPNWDQDATAVAERYWEQSPSVVARELKESAATAAEIFAGIEDDQWDRTGVRSNGSAFTVDSLGRYFLHDLVHHAHDVAPG